MAAPREVATSTHVVNENTSTTIVTSAGARAATAAGPHSHRQVQDAWLNGCIWLWLSNVRASPPGAARLTIPTLAKGEGWRWLQWRMPTQGGQILASDRFWAE